MSNSPIQSIPVGNFDFAMWNNQGEDLRTFQSVSIKRSYMDANGKWQDGGEIRLLPQQLNDLILGAQEMYKFWRIGMKQRKQHGQSEAQTQNAVHEQPSEQQADESAKQGNSGNAPEQAELVAAGSEGKEGFAEKVSQSRGGRRSR